MNTTKIYKNIIFDLDGTLIDSALAITQCLEKSLFNHNIQPSVAITSSLIGPPLQDLIDKVTKNIDSEVNSKICKEFKLLYDNHYYQMNKIFISTDNLKKFNNKYDLFLATNKRYVPTKNIVNFLKWNILIKKTYTLDNSLESIKCKSDLISYLIREEGINRSETLYVGDRKDDMESSINNSIDFAYATWGYERFHPDDKTIILNSPDDILNIDKLVKS